MSNAVYPMSLPGLDATVKKTPNFSTLIQASVSGREVRMGERLYPIWRFQLKYNFLRDYVAFPELTNLGGFYLARLGPLDSFLFADPDDYAVTNQPIGVGNGANRIFQLARPFGAFVEPVFNQASADLLVNGSSVTYTDLGNGSLQATSPPAGGAVVSWTGTYYFRCRFEADKMDFDKFMYQLWSMGTVAMIGSLQDKI